jgi:hypothetical protein
MAHIRRITTIAYVLVLCSALSGSEKRLPAGQVQDASVTVTATLLDAEHVRQAVGSDFNNLYAVLDVQITPKGDKPMAVRLDDFILRSEATGEHSGPLVASQVAGSGELVVARSYGNRSGPGQPRPIEGTKIEMREDDKQNPALEALKKKILAEKTTSQPVEGLLFFPLEKAKAKNLVLSYTSPAGKLRLQFR